MAGMSIDELVLAYELRSEGCGWQRIASGLGHDPAYIRNAVRQAEDRGIHSRLTGFGIDHAPRRYHRKVLEAARLHRAVGMTWRKIAMELTGVGDRAAAKSLCAAVANATNSGYIGNKPKPAANDDDLDDDEPWQVVPSARWTAAGFRIRN